MPDALVGRRRIMGVHPLRGCRAQRHFFDFVRLEIDRFDPTWHRDHQPRAVRRKGVLVEIQALRVILPRQADNPVARVRVNPFGGQTVRFGGGGNQRGGRRGRSRRCCRGISSSTGQQRQQRQGPGQARGRFHERQFSDRTESSDQPDHFGPYAVLKISLILPLLSPIFSVGVPMTSSIER